MDNFTLNEIEEETLEEIFIYECNECGNDIESTWLDYEGEECENCMEGVYYLTHTEMRKKE